jgi:hypothetical protein
MRHEPQAFGCIVGGNVRVGWNGTSASGIVEDNVKVV